MLFDSKNKSFECSAIFDETGSKEFFYVDTLKLLQEKSDLVAA